MCLREKEFLGKGQLEVHHVKEISNGGQDTPDNIWVLCTSCHRELHHRRVYFNSHMTQFFEAYTEYQRMLKKAGGLVDAKSPT